MSDQMTQAEPQKPKLTPTEYQSILSGLNLVGIHLRSCKFFAEPDGIQENAELRASWKTDVTFQEREDGAIAISHTYDLKGKNRNVQVLRVQAEYWILLTSKESFTHDFFDIYKANLLLHTWPYFRELTGSMTTRAGLPQLTLPTVIIR